MEVLRMWIKFTRPFLLGLTIGSLMVYFAVTVFADTDTIRPDGAGTTVAGTAVGCISGLQYECLNEVITEPTVPDTSTDYVQLVNTDTTHVQLGTFTDVDTVTSLTLWIYHSEGGSNARTSVGLYAANESTAYGGPTTLTVRNTAGWDSVTYSGLSLTQANLDDLRLRISCSKQGGGPSNDCFAYASYVDVTFDPLIEVTVGSTGTQQNIDIGTNNNHVGGAFTFTENVSSRNVTSITIEENGTADADNDLKNVKLMYDIDAVTPFDCASESYNGDELQFGATSTNGFSGNDGTITFTDSVGISTTATLCAYPVLDVATTSLAGQTIEIEINDPSTDVLATGADLDILPATTVVLTGQTIIQAQDRDQFAYHWRNDDGNENDPGGATSATGGNATTTFDTLGKLTPTRLRIGISNEGNKTSDSTQYLLEYGRKISTCSNVKNDSSWIDVGAGGGDWDMYDTANLTNGNNTTNIATSIGGFADPAGGSFLSTNGGQLDTSSQSGGITLTASQFVELEYSIEATTNATEGYTYCFRLTNAGTEIETYTYYPEATILADVNVSSLGSQKTTVDIPTTNVYAGGAFSLVDNIAGTTTVNSITLTASGTVDMQNDIEELQLFYEFDTSLPYDCVGLTYNGTENQYGASASGFDISNEATFTESIDINDDRALCIYIEYNASSTITDGEKIDIKIQDASTDVVIGSGTVSPAALVDLPVTTTFVTDITTQVHYHWRDDNGSETGATSATGGSEDTIQENLRRTNPTRLRIGVANEGSSTTPAYQYRLEYALKISTCAAATGWTDVGAADDAFNMYDSANITEGGNTTNIAVANGGVTNVGTTYLTTNGGLKDTSSQTGNITLPGKNYVDLEFSILASTTATDGATYCFRVTDAGTATEIGYDTYPEVSIKPRTGFFVQRGTIDVSGTSATITAGTEYIAPSSSSTAFIRIVGTHNTGAGSPTNSGSADDVTVYISNPSNITNSITFTRPATAVDATRVAWEIIEFTSGSGGDNEIFVREAGTVAYASGNTTVSTGAVPGVVDGDDVAVFITGQMNPDTATNYPLGISTADFSTTTSIATFTRGGSGNTATLSYAVVEFLGDNWKVQRAEHTYSAAGSTETQTIEAVNSLSRAFIHAQKRVAPGLTNHSDFGHSVYLSGLIQVSFTLHSGASTPASHTSVAWIIENIQNVGDTMEVKQVNGSESAGTAPKTVVANIGKTISDTQDASFFVNNFGNETGGGSSQNSFPEPIVSGRIISETQYELWIADPDNDTRTWRGEIVEWPTAARDIVQNYYRFYDNNDLIDPTDPWPEGASDVGENTPVTILDGPIALYDEFRLRMTLQISAATMDPGIDTFNLQYGELDTTCSAIPENEWFDVGGIGSTTALWRGTSTSLTDGTSLSTDPPGAGDLNLTSVADVAGTFEEENPSAFTPYAVDPGEDVEFDWVVQHNGATEKTDYCFRMIESNGTLLDDWIEYPIMRTAGYTPLLANWQFFDDATNTTPTLPLALENSAPSSVENDNVFKLRTTIVETTGGQGEDIKFKLQFSEHSDFSTGVFDVVSTTTCAQAATSSAQLWCYDDGAGDDNAVITDGVLSDSDSCVSGSGAGCGTHNEGISTSTATYDQPGLSKTEYEFTLRNNGARANAVYYFRLFDIKNATTVVASSSYPSLQVEGAALTFTVQGLNPGVSTEGIVTDATSTPSGVQFGSIPFSTEHEVVHRISVNTNATEGYKILMYSDGPLTNTYGTVVPDFTGTNASPLGWSTNCTNNCFGYHAGDDLLQGGSNRFGANDTYAAVTTSPAEIMYSSVPVNESHDIVYKIQVDEILQAGEYQASITYLAVPEF